MTISQPITLTPVSGGIAVFSRAFKNTPILSSLMVFLLLIAISTSVTAEPSTRMLADTCALCHGTDGQSPGSIDELFGMEAEEFMEEMREFKSQHETEGRIMRPITRAYTDQQIRELARYFETLPLRK